ncbi:histidine kinase [uncultured Piscinibacter sp.]|uniref:sensor histidine kinase n=1 Tax=uncultured Piscinibacter sp. TaxID=1131835 RepID=UPI002638980A|nr:histidine kinase [uncultured Piscinibacter sp.]
MAATTSTSVPIDATPQLGGPSVEMRRFAAGMRAITALLCTLLLVNGEPRISPWALTVLLTYVLWAASVMWLEATGRARGASLPYFAVDVAWASLTLQLVDTGSQMLVVTLVQPVVLASIGYGVGPGVMLALFAGAGLLFDHSGGSLVDMSARQAVLALAVLLVVPGAALLARPMGVLRGRMALLDELEAKLDPRRGLEPICGMLVERLRAAAQADVVALVLPSGLGAPAMFSSCADGSFRARPDAHRCVEALLQRLPDRPARHARRDWWDLRRPSKFYGQPPVAPGPHAGTLDELAGLLDMRMLHVVPLMRYGRRHGHLVVGYSSVCGVACDVPALATAAPDMLRIVEQAALVDQLQEEGASHERVRIGRDLHDSAIQPYLGLKYAVECVALRVPPDNPARAEIDSLAALVNGEVDALRELISGLRSGTPGGENTLIPAVRRQVRRFASLFGLEIEFDCPDQLPTTRAFAGALFHMVNEALNNVRKHTAARRVWITLSQDGQCIRLAVRDDGGSVSGRPADDFHPCSLSERTRELGGTIEVTRPDGLNTEILIRVPL